MYRGALAAFSVCGLLGAAACSDEPAAQTADSSLPHGNGICIQTQFVDHTDIPDDRTIIFHMKGGVMWKNTLPFSCSSLRSEGGFAYVNSIPEICSNQQTIQVLRSGILCELGQFTPYMPPGSPGAVGETPK